jgi:hypothetical protein
VFSCFQRSGLVRPKRAVTNLPSENVNMRTMVHTDDEVPMLKYVEVFQQLRVLVSPIFICISSYNKYSIIARLSSNSQISLIT